MNVAPPPSSEYPYLYECQVCGRDAFYLSLMPVAGARMSTEILWYNGGEPKVGELMLCQHCYQPACGRYGNVKMEHVNRRMETQ